jgi:hypothetical protein
VPEISNHAVQPPSQTGKTRLSWRGCIWGCIHHLHWQPLAYSSIFIKLSFVNSPSCSICDQQKDPTGNIRTRFNERPQGPVQVDRTVLAQTLDEQVPCGVENKHDLCNRRASYRSKVWTTLKPWLCGELRQPKCRLGENFCKSRTR